MSWKMRHFLPLEGRVVFMMSLDLLPNHPCVETFCYSLSRLTRAWMTQPVGMNKVTLIDSHIMRDFRKISNVMLHLLLTNASFGI